MGECVLAEGDAKIKDLNFIYGNARVMHCVVVVMDSIMEKYHKQKLFFPHPSTKVLEDYVGLECFWPFTNVSQSSTLASTSKASGIHVDSPLVRLNQGSGQSSHGETKYDATHDDNTCFTILSIRRKFWHGKDCQLVDDAGVVIAEG
jgi:hypothetical protein